MVLINKEGIGIGELAKDLDIDPYDLNKILSGSRNGLNYLVKAHELLLGFNEYQSQGPQIFWPQTRRSSQISVEV